MRAGSSFCPHCGEPAVFDSGVTTEIPLEPSPFSRSAAPAPSSPPPTAPAPQPPPGPPPAAAPPVPPGPQATAAISAMTAMTQPPAEPTPTAPTAPGALPYPAAAPTGPSTTPGTPTTTRSFGELMAGFSSGVLGGTVAVAFGVLQTLPALVTGLNDNDFSKGGFLVLAMLAVAVVVTATAALWGRARQARAQGRPLEAVEALSLGAGLFVSTYGVLLLLSVLVSDEGAAVQLVL